MLKTWLSDATIMLRQSVETWPQALDICAQPLLKGYPRPCLARQL